MSVNAIDAQGLSRRYGRSWAVANVTFHLPSGRVLLVAGPNGSGKTTLFRVLTTAIRADAGSAQVAGFDLNDRDGVRRHTALLTHQLYVYEALTAAENLRIFAQFSGQNGSAVDGLLHEVGLAGSSPQPVSSFSAGMRKRLALARVLLQLVSREVAVVFFDEPYDALDAEGLNLVDGLIQRLHGEGRTVVLASHLVERCATLATDAMLLESGRLVWQGAPSELLSRHKLRVAERMA